LLDVLLEACHILLYGRHLADQGPELFLCAGLGGCEPPKGLFHAIQALAGGCLGLYEGVDLPVRGALSPHQLADQPRELCELLPQQGGPQRVLSMRAAAPAAAAAPGNP
jgi:hypothetical protein